MKIDFYNPSRVIKFRRWNNKLKRFTASSTFTNYSRICVEASDNTIWQMYTGFTDKNEKEIYEGDILKAMLDPSQKKSYSDIWEVIFGCGCFFVRRNVYYYSDGVRKEPEPFYIAGQYARVEVIGNILENPELLEE